MFTNFDLKQLSKVPGFSYYFRYPLHHSDFHEVRREGRLIGRVASKALYRGLTRNGLVDRPSGLNGQIAAIFIRARSRSSTPARLFLTRIPRRQVLLPSGRRNCKAIDTAVERVVLERSVPAASKRA